MKNSRFFFRLVLLLGLISNINVFGQYMDKDITLDRCKKSIKTPYIYDGYWMSNFIFDQNPKKIKSHLVAFAGEKYQIVFCSSGFEEKVKVTIYHRKSRAEARTKVYESTKNSDGSTWSFEPSKSGDYFVEYLIPPGISRQPKPAYVLILVGTIIEMEDF